MRTRHAVAWFAIVLSGCATSADDGNGIFTGKKDTGVATDGGGDETSITPTDSGTSDTSVPPDDTSVPPDDTSVPPDDTSIPPDDTSVPPDDTGVVDTGTPDTFVPGDGSVGAACADDIDCDSFTCSKGFFTSGDLYPSNVCLDYGCDYGDGTAIMGCGADKGVCLQAGTTGLCLPKCDFDDSTTAPTGCLGKDYCNPYGFGTDATTSKPIGVGYCFGGCKVDADCAIGQRCQTEDGLCVTTKVTYTKTLGTACTDADSTAPAKCNCLYATSSKKGYCSQTCRMGMSGDCPTGYACDALLPKTKVLTSDVVFTKAATGLAGYCLKTCTTDADCTNGYCDENAGVGAKTCQVGARRCSSTAPCPTGKTCSGATATTAGTCI